MTLTAVERYFARASGLSDDHSDEWYTTDPMNGPLIPHVASKSQIGAVKFDKAAFGIFRRALRGTLSGLLGTDSVTVNHEDIVRLMCKTCIAASRDEAEKIIPEILQEGRVYLDDHKDFYLAIQRVDRKGQAAYRITRTTAWDL